VSTDFILVLCGGLATLALLAYAFLGGASPAKESRRRLETVRYRHSQNTETRVESQLKKAIASRRSQKGMFATDSTRMQQIQNRLDRTGKGWSVTGYMNTCIGLGLVVGGLVFLKSGALFLGLFVGVIVGLGLPHLYVSRLITKRTAQFNARFPDAIELLVRGLRSGLPVTETLQVVAREVPGPVGQEFKGICERIRIGRTMDEALQVAAEKLGIPEFNFFCISLAIQRETGGNLAETLSNLSEVLRKRSQMKLKIKAMSSESKASAYIVGALPFLVFGLVYYMKPDYLQGFFTEDRLIIAGLGGMVWMGIGAFIMAKMINFEI